MVNITIHLSGEVSEAQAEAIRTAIENACQTLNLSGSIEESRDV